MTVWVTRSAPDNLATARRLRAVGERPVLMPVLGTRALPHRALRASAIDAVVFTSVHAVRHHRASAAMKLLPVHVASTGVAEAAVAAGYRQVTTIGPDEHLLAEYMAAVLPAGSRVIIYCSARTSRRIDDRLDEAGHRVRRIVPYEAVPLPCPIEQAEALSGIDGIVVHSRASAVAISAMLRDIGWCGTIWCISRAAAEPLASLGQARVMIASAPHEAALMALIGGQQPRSAQGRGRGGQFRRLIDRKPLPANDDEAS